MKEMVTFLLKALISWLTILTMVPGGSLEGAEHRTMQGKSGVSFGVPVPAKMCIFGYRIACDNLATTRNKHRTNLENMSTCKLCDMNEENSFHATVSCTKARALREKMRDYWDLPPETMLRYTGKDWLLILLDRCNTNQRAGVLLVL
jgi:hypothetical protein